MTTATNVKTINAPTDDCESDLEYRNSTSIRVHHQWPVVG